MFHAASLKEIFWKVNWASANQMWNSEGLRGGTWPSAVDSKWHVMFGFGRRWEMTLLVPIWNTAAHFCGLGLSHPLELTSSKHLLIIATDSKRYFFGNFSFLRGANGCRWRFLASVVTLTNNFRHYLVSQAWIDLGIEWKYFTWTTMKTRRRAALW